MKVLLAVLLSVAPSLAAQRTYFGPALSQCLALSGDVSTSNFTVTGSATHFAAIDDAPSSSCLLSSTHDSDATTIACAASTTCTDVFDLANTSGLSAKRILYVQANGIIKKDTGSGSATITVYAVIGGSDYSLGVISTTGTTYGNESFATKTYTNPATGLAWTSSDIDSIQIKLVKSSSARVATLTAINVTVAYDDGANFGTLRQRSGGGN